MKFRVLWDVLPCSQIDVDRRFRAMIALIMEAARTSETSVYFNGSTSQKTLNFIVNIVSRNIFLHKMQ
jgi:hypothetical protein